MLAEQFAARYRLSGYSLAFSVGLGLGGGTAPLIATALIGATKNALAAPLYLMAGALLSVGALCFMADRSRAPLP
jgi:MHS family proline/betaine transporter-like MFS transporter